MNISEERSCPKWICLIGACTVLLLLLCACDKPDPLPVEGDFSEFTAEETAFLEEVFDRDISKITQSHLNTVYTLSFVGDRILRSDFTFTDCSEEGYMYNGELVPYDMDCAPDLSLLRLFPNLKNLGIYFCPALTDASGLAALQRLEKLSTYMTSVTDLSSLSSLTDLSYVFLRGTPVKTISFAENNHMNHLQISNAALTDLSFLERCPTLTLLYIKHNTVPLQNTEHITALTGLYTLSILAPDTDFSFLKNVTAPIAVLGLGGTENIDLNMSEILCKSVQNISVANSGIVDLSPLDACSALTMLGLYVVKDYTDPKGVAEKIENFIVSDLSYDFFLFWKPEV